MFKNCALPTCLAISFSTSINIDSKPITMKPASLFHFVRHCLSIILVLSLRLLYTNTHTLTLYLSYTHAHTLSVLQTLRHTLSLTHTLPLSPKYTSTHTHTQTHALSPTPPSPPDAIARC